MCVDKTGCIKLRGKEYEVGIEWIKKTVDARYDPFDLMQIEIWVQAVNPNFIGAMLNARCIKPS